MPKVSVVIPTCNRPDLLPRAIKSVLAQTFQDFEIIVIDDGQKNSAREAVSVFSDSRIIYIKHEESRGGAAARNTGIKAAKGDCVAFLDDDDEWLPEKLDKQVKGLNGCDKDVVLAFTGLYEYSSEGKILLTRLPEQSGVVWPFERVLHRSYIWTSVILVKKEIALAVLFDENLKKNQEWDFQLRLLRVGKFFAINEPLVKLHVLGENEHMGGKGNLDNIISAFEIFINKHYSDYKKYPKSLSLCYSRLAIFCQDGNRLRKAWWYLFRAWIVWPKNLKNLRHFLVFFLKIPFLKLSLIKNKSLKNKNAE